MKVKSLSRVRLLAAPWTAAYQAPPSTGFSSQEYWSGEMIQESVNLKMKYPVEEHREVFLEGRGMKRPAGACGIIFGSKAYRYLEPRWIAERQGCRKP